jgi:hypothetical protein
MLDRDGSPLSHSVAGLFLVTVPLVLVLHTLATALVLPWLLRHLPGGPPLHLHALARCRPATSPAGLVRVASSALVGGATHVFLDGFTHGNHSGWALSLLPALATPVPHPGGPLPLHDALQVWLTLVLGAFALREWHRMAAALPAPGPGAAAAWELVPATPLDQRRVQGFLLVAGLAGALAGPVLTGTVGTPDALKLAAYGAVTLASLAAVAGALADRGRRATRWPMDKSPRIGLG